MASVNVHNCVRFYTTADEIGAETLKEHSSGLISAHWVSWILPNFYGAGGFIDMFAEFCPLS
jgi:hypothetical protein